MDEEWNSGRRVNEHTPTHKDEHAVAITREAPGRARGQAAPRQGTMGVTVETLRPGDGKSFPQSGQTVIVHYVGTLTNGWKFDSSRDRGEPFKFKLGQGQVIRGWDEGVAQMSLHQKAMLTCTPDYAYGSTGFPPIIPGNSTLLFEVELLGFS